MSSANESIYIFKSKPKKNFTTSCNEMVEDRRLSAAARLMLVYLTGRPTNWRTKMKQVCDVCCLGRDSGYKRMKELIDVGYVHRQYSGPAGPKRKVEYFVFDSIEACATFKATHQAKRKKPKPVPAPQPEIQAVVSSAADDVDSRISGFQVSATTSDEAETDGPGADSDVLGDVDSGKVGNYKQGNYFHGHITKTDSHQRLTENKSSSSSSLSHLHPLAPSGREVAGRRSPAAPTGSVAPAISMAPLPPVWMPRPSNPSQKQKSDATLRREAVADAKFDYDRATEGVVDHETGRFISPRHIAELETIVADNGLDQWREWMTALPAADWFGPHVTLAWLIDHQQKLFALGDRHAHDDDDGDMIPF